MSNPEHLYVRLRPFDRQAGHVVRRYDWRIPNSTKFLTFTRAGVWHKVPFRYAEALREARQDERNPLSPPVFDVCTEEEARVLDSRAQAEREAARRLVEPTVDTAVNMMDSSPAKKPSSRTSALSDFNAAASGQEDEDDDEGEEIVPEEADFSKPAKPRVDKNWTKKELLAEARKRGIPTSSSDNKAMLIELLNK